MGGGGIWAEGVSEHEDDAWVFCDRVVAFLFQRGCMMCPLAGEEGGRALPPITCCISF